MIGGLEESVRALELLGETQLVQRMISAIHPSSHVTVNISIILFNHSPLFVFCEGAFRDEFSREMCRVIIVSR